MTEAATTGLESLEAALNLLLGLHTGFDARVRLVPCQPIEGFPRVRSHFHYLSFRDGLPAIDEFLDYLKWQMVPFCLPRRDRLRVKQMVDATNDVAERSRLIVGEFEKARELFIKAQKQQKKAGEPGELILFVLLEWALRAPQLISKMYLKTSTEMPVHGSDGIHVGMDSDGKTLLLFFGESKLHADLSGGLSAAFDSIKEFREEDGKEKREIDIVRDHMNLGEDQQTLKQALLEYLDPYTGKEKANLRRHVFACFLGFDYDKYAEVRKLSPEKVEEEFCKLFQQRIGDALGMIKSRLGKDGMDVVNFEFFLIPFPSVEEFRKAFFKHTGIGDVG